MNRKAIIKFSNDQRTAIFFVALLLALLVGVPLGMLVQARISPSALGLAAAKMEASGWAAWVQAIGSILAIFVAIYVGAPARRQLKLLSEQNAIASFGILKGINSDISRDMNLVQGLKAFSGSGDQIEEEFSKKDWGDAGVEFLDAAIDAMQKLERQISLLVGELSSANTTIPWGDSSTVVLRYQVIEKALPLKSKISQYSTQLSVKRIPLERQVEFSEKVRWWIKIRTDMPVLAISTEFRDLRLACEAYEKPLIDEHLSLQVAMQKTSSQFHASGRMRPHGSRRAAAPRSSP